MLSKQSLHFSHYPQVVPQQLTLTAPTRNGATSLYRNQLLQQITQIIVIFCNKTPTLVMQHANLMTKLLFPFPLRDTRTEFWNFHINCNNFMTFLLCILHHNNWENTNLNYFDLLVSEILIKKLISWKLIGQLNWNFVCLLFSKSNIYSA